MGCIILLLIQTPALRPCYWSSFGLDLLQDVATTKGKCQFILHFVGIFDFVRLKILQIRPLYSAVEF